MSLLASLCKVLPANASCSVLAFLIDTCVCSFRFILACSIVCLGSDNKIFIWNVGTAEVVTEIELPEIAMSASWSYSGSLFVVSCKDKKIRIIDPRSGSVVQVDSDTSDTSSL